jgi:hypothetical protein
MKLVQECTFRAMLKPPLPIGPGPIGTRVYYEIDSGEVEGERLRGKVLGGGEWALIGPDGYLRVDVRAQVQTHDGASARAQRGGAVGRRKRRRHGLRSARVLHEPALRDRRPALLVAQHHVLRRRGTPAGGQRRRIQDLAAGIENGDVYRAMSVSPLAGSRLLLASPTKCPR